MLGWRVAEVTALTVAVSAMSFITAVNAGSCAPGSTQNCFNMPGRLDFSSVPVISQQIVSEEKTDSKQKQPTGEPPSPAPYTARFSGRARAQAECR